jgi:hypothetical protein
MRINFEVLNTTCFDVLWPCKLIAKIIAIVNYLNEEKLNIQY